MAETICRTLREGEHAPAFMIKGSIAGPFGFDVFINTGLVIVAFSRSPLFYVDLLKRKGIDVASSHKWKLHLLSISCQDVRNLDKLYSSIIKLGKGLIGQGKIALLCCHWHGSGGKLKLEELAGSV